MAAEVAKETPVEAASTDEEYADAEYRRFLLAPPRLAYQQMPKTVYRIIRRFLT